MWIAKVGFRPAPHFSQTRAAGFFNLAAMNANHYIHNELRQLESSAHVALGQIRNSKSIREVVLGMNVPVPAVVRSIRRLAPSYPRIESEAHRRAESIVRGQMSTLEAAESEEEFLRLRGRYQPEWRQLNGRFPKLASYVQVESARLLARLRNPNQTQSRCPAPATR